MTWTYDLGGLIHFRPMTDSWDDAYTVARWMNLDPVRRKKYGMEVYTPDTHIASIRNRAAHDFLWMICDRQERAIGQTGLTISVRDYTAEYGKLFIDPAFRGLDYGLEQMYMVLTLAFEFFGLQRIWAEVRDSNGPAKNLYCKAGWVYIGSIEKGHPSDRGPVWTIDYPIENWPPYRQQFIEQFGVKL